MIKQGDIAWLDLDPQIGNEQSGRRPVVVVSNEYFHNRTSQTRAMICPITRTDNRFSLHVKLNEDTKTQGFAMCEQIKILDIGARNYRFIEEMPEEILSEILGTMGDFIVKDPKTNIVAEVAETN